jgi:hypothetical protein
MEVTSYLHMEAGKGAFSTQWIGGWMGPRAGWDAVRGRKVSLP